jgi:excisionase family DNA binding protein
MPTPRESSNDAVQPKSLMTRSEVAALLGVSPTTVTRWAREGRLACRVTLGGHHRFERGLVEDIRTRMLRGGTQRPSPAGRRT